MASANDGAAQIRKLIDQPWLLFLGAGTSVPCGIKPWRSLAEAAIQFGTEHGVPDETLAYARSSVERGRLSLVFDAIEQEIPCGAWTGWLKREMTPTRGFTETHTSLLKLRPSGVITTNYDTLADGAYGQILGRGPAVFENDPPSLLAVQASTEFVCHFHGMVEGRGTTVLGAQSYRQFYGGTTGPRDCVRQLLMRYNVLYVGFGHADLDFEHLCQGALEQLNPSYYAISLLPSDAVPPAFAERLRRLNINVVTYDKVDADHSGLTQLVRLLAPDSHAVHSAALRLSRHGSETTLPTRSAIVGIMCLEEGAHGEMTKILPASAMLASLLELSGPTTIADLHASLATDYSLSSSFTVAKAQELARQLEVEGIITVSEDQVSVETATRDRLMGLVDQKRADLRKLVVRITDLAIEEGAAPADRAQLERNIEHFLGELFRRHGVDVADSILANRPVVQDLAGAVKRSAETLSPNNRRTQIAIQRAVLRIFRDPSSDDAKAIYWLCQTYFLMGAYAIDPDGSVLSKSLFSGVRLWLDSNVILPVLADYHPLQVSYSRLLEGSVAQGSHLLVLTNLLDEVFGNSERAWSVASELDFDPIAIDIYVESLGWERANVFLVGFTRAHRAGRHETWEEYAKETGLPQSNGGATFRAQIRALVERKLKASIQRPSLNQLELSQISVLANEIEDRRKAAWQFRYKVLCRNEAVQILQVYHDRNLAERTDGTPAAWFISTDGFVNRLFEHHAADWLLPSAQHPIRWFQALEAVTAAAAAYKGFSRLFMNVALTAYREDHVRGLLARLHAQYRDLMAKRPDEVKALYLRALKEFASSTEEDLGSVLTPKELSEREEEAVQLALARFNEDATRLFGEYDVIKAQLREAKAHAATLEKELSRRGTKELRKGYRQRQLEQQVRQQQERISELTRALKDSGKK
jgi:hypothetical protein